MTKWSLATKLVNISHRKYGSADEIWTFQEKTGTTAWQDLQKMAEEGWELVSTCSINYDGYTNNILYTFKRPIEEGS